MSLSADNIKRPKDMEGKTYGGFGGALETALITDRKMIPAATKKKLAAIIDKYFS